MYKTQINFYTMSAFINSLIITRELLYLMTLSTGLIGSIESVSSVCLSACSSEEEEDTIFIFSLQVIKNQSI